MKAKGDGNKATATNISHSLITKPCLASDGLINYKRNESNEQQNQRKNPFRRNNT